MYKIHFLPSVALFIWETHGKIAFAVKIDRRKYSCNNLIFVKYTRLNFNNVLSLIFYILSVFHVIN